MSEPALRVTDWRGNSYGVGDVILYPRMSGRSCEMQEGTVLKLTPFEDTRSTFGEDGRYTGPETFTNYKVRVQPTRSSRRFGRWSDKAVTLQIGENVTAAP